MKLTAIMLFACIGLAYATESYSQSATLSLNVTNKTVQDVLDEIEKQSEFHFFYNNKQVNTTRIVSINSKKKNVFNVLEQLFNGTDISYKVLDKSIILSPKEILATASPIAQQTIKNISGKITDSNGEAIIGANVMEKGSTNGTVTDIDGNFTLSVPADATLIISYIGYETIAIPVAKKNVFQITLKEDSQNLEEVVVTALGIKRSEKALGYSVQKVGGEELTAVKGTNIATSLTGKIAGVTILNKNDFNTAPTVLLRGETPLVVIDGVPYENTGLGQVSADDIESINVLKGSTASALYGSKGAAGALMITTKRGNKEGLNISVNSNTMLNLGHLVLPEIQHGYSSGSGGKYLQEKSEYIWGDKLDIGRTAVQYDPYTYEWREMELTSRGKNNFKNFLETSFILNNNVNISYKGKDGSVRASMTHIYDKGQFPGNKLNKFNYTVAGDMKKGKFSLDASINYNMSLSPQTRGTGYSGLGYMYNMIVWTGTDFDVRDYKNYWVAGKEGEQQNWNYSADYNNPYFIANEITSSFTQARANGHINANYEITDWLKGSARIGSDTYNHRTENKTPLDVRNSWTGAYSISNYRTYSVTGDAMLMADKKLGDFNVGGIIGAGLTYYDYAYQTSSTKGGLTVPGFYSLNGSVETPNTSSSMKRRQTNSIYGKLETSWKNAIFLEVTGRNDWVSTLEEKERSYFYPSVSTSVILSELVPLPELLTFWKLRGSWTMTKKPADIYSINRVYSLTTNAWNDQSAAYAPRSIRDDSLGPESTREFEVGTVINFFQNRLRIDVAYYNKLFYDIQREASVSYSSGFSSSLINYDEERIKKGWELTVAGDIFKSKNFDWTSTFNWSRDRYYYHKIDENYSTDRTWVKPGERWDWFEVTDWERDPEGNIVHSGGLPVVSKYAKHAGFERASWVWGWNNHLRYKNFTLDISIDGRVGGKAYNRLEQAMWNSGTHIQSDNQWRYDEVVNGEKNYVGKGVVVVSGKVEYDSYGRILSDTRVFEKNTTPVGYESYIKAYHPWNGSARSQNIKSLTFFKIREMALGYKVPQVFTQKAGISNLHLSLVAQNPLLWAKEFKYSDPDAIYEDNAETLNSPAMRYVGFNIKLDF